MTPAPAAIDTILRHAPVLGTERVKADRCCGRILRQPIHAGRDAPPFDRVMMDGYAVAAPSISLGKWEIEGIALAGHEPPVLENSAGCIEVTTGCILPGGCDTVIPVEDCRIEGTRMQLVEGSEIQPGQYIHSMGSDTRAGDCVLEAGAFLGPPELAVLATEGISEVEVGRQPRIGLITTGDEVITDGRTPGRTQIRGSHYEALMGLFSHFPGLPFMHRHSRDDAGDLSDALTVYLECSDILLITGGVSMGRKDIVPEILEQLGVTKVLHRVAQRPGKPLWFGTNSGKLVLGLPGNPISSLICARRYVFPLVERMTGSTPFPPLRVTLENRVDPLENMTWFLPVCQTGDGLIARPYATSGSLQNLAGTSGFVEVPPSGQSVMTFNYYPWNSR